MVTCCVFFAVRSKFLNIIWTNFGFNGLTVAIYYRFSENAEDVTRRPMFTLQRIQRGSFILTKRYFFYDTSRKSIPSAITNQARFTLFLQERCTKCQYILRFHQCLKNRVTNVYPRKYRMQTFHIAYTL
jgi:hypothetical protein